MNLHEEWVKLLQEIGPGKMMTTAYDTAWIARLVEIGEPIGHLALEWLRENQLPDGSWGATQPCYYHDRVICTLAAINALARRARPSDRERLRRAEAALATMTSRLHEDPAGETIGFELIVPTLLQETKALGALHSEGMEVLKSLAPLRSAKLASLPNGMINRFVTVAFSAEMAGNDGKDSLDIDNLQEQDGSISYSPSATAYFTLYVRRRNAHALTYLYRVAANGIAPNVAPFDTFEPAWVLWNLKLISGISDEILQLCQPHLDFLKKEWVTGKGIGFAANYAAKDSDVTSLVYDVLSSFGISVDLDAVLRYEQPFYFRCYDLESNPSVSANIHVLGALRRAGFAKMHTSVQKVLNFLTQVRTNHTFWFDKWQASPYYATSHAIISCSGYADDVIINAVDWILKTQNQDGSWGYYMSTAEETAYCLQALVVHQRYGHEVSYEALRKGSEWLIQHSEPPYPPLWIGKCLYSPVLVVRSAILSALLMVK
ncbi:MAG: type B diterpene cyclase [Anaerolineae bacterium]